MPVIHLRRAKSEDADAIADIHTAARSEAMSYLPELHTDEETRDWIARVVLPAQQVWVAEREGRVIGVAALDGATLEQLYVLPEEQGRWWFSILPCCGLVDLVDALHAAMDA